MRSQFANLRTLVLPGGAITGTRIVIDGTDGSIKFYDENDVLVGLLSPDQWYVGAEDNPDFPSRVVLDPLTGIRLYRAGSAGAAVGATLSGGRGLEFTNSEGVITSALDQYGYTLSDVTGGQGITLTNGALDNQVPEPHVATTATAAPGSTIDTPAAVGFDANDFVLRFATVFADSELGAQSMTPPAGYTERVDLNSSSNGATHGHTIATDQPGSGAVATFTSTSSAWDVDNAHTVVVKSAAGTPTSYRSAVTTFDATTEQTFDLSFAKPTGLTAGDLMVGCVSFAHVNGGLPLGYTIPNGWRQLSIQFALVAGGCLASIVVYKVADAGDVAGSGETVVIATGTDLAKLVKGTVVAIETPLLIDAVADIQIGGRSMSRGVFFAERFSSAANSAAYTSSLTDMAISVAVKANRAYHIHVDTALLYSNSTPGRFQFNVHVDGVRVGIVDTQSILNANDLVRHLKGEVAYYPTADATVTITLVTARAVGAGTVTLVGVTESRRRLELIDVGARVSP